MSTAAGELFSEFEGFLRGDVVLGSGAVKYHQGFHSYIQTAGRPVHLSLVFNPPHPENVCPVLNNQIGFTASDPRKARSTKYRAAVRTGGARPPFPWGAVSA